MLRKPFALSLGYVVLAFTCAAARAQGAADEDAAALYLKAAGAGFDVQSPSETSMEYADYPPYPAEWHKLAKAARQANAPRLALARQARSAPAGKWPGGADLAYLNRIRSLANELGDAALYEQTQGNHAEGIEFARDLLYLGRSLRAGTDKQIVQMLVGVGVEAMASHRLLVMVPGLTIAKEGAAKDGLTAARVREVMAELTTQRDVKEELAAALAIDGPIAAGGKPIDVERLREQVNRVNAEEQMVAMSLACQLFRADKGRWPASAADFVPAYLPKLALDPWGDGKQTLGYALIKAGLPDGSDRPLVYSRCNAKDGLFYRLDEPQYSFYSGDGSNTPAKLQKHGGQFRDVARWTAAKRPPGAPATKMLE